MVITAMIQLDEIDCSILNALQQEGRISIIDLAERVGLSATPCARRVKHLEDEGVIERYTAVLNPRVLGKRLDVFVNVRLRSSTSEAIEIFERAIKSMPEVVECYLVTGNYDYLVHIKVADIDDFKSYVRERLSGIASVGETVSSIALEQTKHTTSIALPS
jgi:Lrp/AsnC family transcriptional regulator, leucine-responsive regulatory protein